MTLITAYDGANTIGGNKIFVSDGDTGVFLDFGKSFSRYGRFYEEFLKNRDTRGIHDLIVLNLIPKLNIYRQDLIPGDLQMAQYPCLNIAAVLLSHAHLDHCGNIGLLDLSIPVVASPMSIAILKGMQDIAKSSLDTDVCYVTERKPLPADELFLKSIDDSCNGKKFLFTDEPRDELVNFLSKKPGQDTPRAKKKLVPGVLAPCHDYPLPFEIEAFDVDHSIYGATAYLLNGEPTIAYTGDIRLHGRNGETTRNFVAHAKGAEVLIIEGTRVPKRVGLVDGFQATEETVRNNCTNAVRDAEGLVIADFSARNFERLEMFSEIADKTGREIVITTKDVYMLHSLEQADGVDRLGNISVYDEIAEHTKKWETEVAIGRAGDKLVTHKELHDNAEQYVACFSFFDMKNMLDISPDKGTYIYSSCEPFNEEMEIDFKRLWEWLVEFNLEPRGIVKTGDESGAVDIEKGYHASGHASPADILWVIDQIDPDVVIPIHTENKQWFMDNYDNVVDLKDGQGYEC